MNVVRNLRLSTRLALGFGLVVLFLVGVAILGLVSMAQIQHRLDDIASVNNKQARLAVAMRIAVHQIATRSRDMVLYDGVRKRTASEAIATARSAYDAAETQLGAMFAAHTDTSQRETELFARLGEFKAKTMPLVDKVVELARSDLSDEAVSVQSTEVDAPLAAWLEMLAELADLEEQASIQAAEEAQQAYARARMLMIAMCLIGVVLGIAAAWLISTGITRPIANAVRIARTVSTGDLTSRIEVRSNDEAGQLMSALRDMNRNLVKVVATVRASSDSISTGASEISAGNQDLSQRTEQQASNLQQTAASMEQIGSAVQANADTARQAAQLSTAAASAAAQGGTVVGQVVSTMDAISASSRKVSEIIGVIEGIAFQTNILALNAAVEAARAGEQGRGFAVVASEVRSLAGRSAQAAKEIKELIGESVERIEAGTTQAGAAGTAMRDIVGQVQRVADLISEISAATGEQTSGIGQVSHAVTQLDQVTQQNAALVEESAAAAASLNAQAQRLVEAVGVFRLSDEEVQALRTTAAPFSPAPHEAVEARGRASVAGRPKPPRRATAPGQPPVLAPRLASAASGRDADWKTF